MSDKIMGVSENVKDEARKIARSRLLNLLVITIMVPFLLYYMQNQFRGNYEGFSALEREKRAQCAELAERSLCMTEVEEFKSSAETAFNRFGFVSILFTISIFICPVVALIIYRARSSVRSIEVA